MRPPTGSTGGLIKKKQHSMVTYGDVILRATLVANRAGSCPAKSVIKSRIKREKGVKKVVVYAWKRANERLRRDGLISNGMVTTQGFEYMKARNILPEDETVGRHAVKVHEMGETVDIQKKIGAKYAGFYVVIGRHGCPYCHEAVDLLMQKGRPFIYLHLSQSLSIRQATVPAIFLPDRTFLGDYSELVRYLSRSHPTKKLSSQVDTGNRNIETSFASSPPDDADTGLDGGLEVEEWERAIDQECLRIEDILSLGPGDQIKVLLLDRNLWDVTNDPAQNPSSTLVEPQRFFRDNWAIYTHTSNLRGKIEYSFGYEREFEFDLEYEAGSWSPLVDGQLNKKHRRRHYTDFDSSTRVGWRGPMVLWDKLITLPKVYWVPKK